MIYHYNSRYLCIVSQLYKSIFIVSFNYRPLLFNIYVEFLSTGVRISAKTKHGMAAKITEISKKCYV